MDLAITPELRAAFEANGIHTLGHAEPKTCGTCRLWAPIFYTHLSPSSRGTTCCADAIMDLPASFIPARQIMGADDGADCIAWRSDLPSDHPPC